MCKDPPWNNLRSQLKNKGFDVESGYGCETFCAERNMITLSFEPLDGKISIWREDFRQRTKLSVHSCVSFAVNKAIGYTSDTTKVRSRTKRAKRKLSKKEAFDE